MLFSPSIEKCGWTILTNGHVLLNLPFISWCCICLCIKKFRGDFLKVISFVNDFFWQIQHSYFPGLIFWTFSKSLNFELNPGHNCFVAFKPSSIDGHKVHSLKLKFMESKPEVFDKFGKKLVFTFSSQMIVTVWLIYLILNHLDWRAKFCK